MSAWLRVMSPLTSGFSPTFPKAVSSETLVHGVPRALTPQSLLPSASTCPWRGLCGALPTPSSHWSASHHVSGCQELAQRPSPSPSPPLAKPSMRGARPSWNNTASSPPTSTGLFTAHQGLHTHELTGAFPTHLGNPAGPAPLPPFCRWRH